MLRCDRSERNSRADERGPKHSCKLTRGPRTRACAGGRHGVYCKCYRFVTRSMLDEQLLGGHDGTVASPSRAFVGELRHGFCSRRAESARTSGRRQSRRPITRTPARAGPRCVPKSMIRWRSSATTSATTSLRCLLFQPSGLGEPRDVLAAAAGGPVNAANPTRRQSTISSCTRASGSAWPCAIPTSPNPGTKHLPSQQRHQHL